VPSDPVPFTREHLIALGDVLVRVAAEELMPRFGRLQASQISTKTSAFDVVTEADVASERAIIAALEREFPAAVFIGEEGVHADPALLDMLGSAELGFVIDPLDGTRNFACGIPLFGVMVAVVIRGHVAGGAIHDPVTGSTALALRDRGAWQVDRSGGATPLHVAAPAPVARMEAIVGTNFLPEPLRSQVSSRLSRLAMNNWFRCAAHEYRLAAAGYCHVLFYNKLMPWDHAAGWLIHREAGGYGAHFDGSPYLPAHTSGGMLCAPDRESWTQVHDALFR